MPVLRYFEFAASNSCSLEGRMKMKNLLFGLILAFLCTWALAQDTTSASKSKSDTRTITGCLAKGNDANEYLLTTKDGSTWELKSTVASLGDHVGHTVAATGVVQNARMHNLKEDAQEAAKDTGVTKNNKEHGHMKVTDVQMVSDSCSQ
jgi:hypothetical protein